MRPNDPANRVANTYLTVAAAAIMTSAGLGLWKPVLVIGHSMEPTLPPRTLALTVNTPAHQLRAGDIAVVIQDGQPVIHRVLHTQAASSAEAKRQAETLVWTKGDANTHVDSPTAIDAAQLVIVHAPLNTALVLFAISLAPLWAWPPFRRQAPTHS